MSKWLLFISQWCQTHSSLMRPQFCFRENEAYISRSKRSDERTRTTDLLIINRKALRSLLRCRGRPEPVDMCHCCRSVDSEPPKDILAVIWGVAVRLQRRKARS